MSLTACRVLSLAAGVAAAGCSLIVDVGDLSRDDAGRPDADAVADGVDGEVGGDADADVDQDEAGDAGDEGDVVAPDGEDTPSPDGDAVDEGGADDAEAFDGDAGGDDDAAGADGDGGADADADGSETSDGADATVGPPARIWGEMTTSGAVPDGTGCAARGAGVCLRSDTTDSAGQVLTGGAFRLRGIVVQGGAR